MPHISYTAHKPFYLSGDVHCQMGHVHYFDIQIVVQFDGAILAMDADENSCQPCVLSLQMTHDRIHTGRRSSCIALLVVSSTCMHAWHVSVFVKSESGLVRM